MKVAQTFTEFFDAPVQITDTGSDFNICFTVQIEDESQDTMRCRVLRTHIDIQFTRLEDLFYLRHLILSTRIPLIPLTA